MRVERRQRHSRARTVGATILAGGTALGVGVTLIIGHGERPSSRGVAHSSRSDTPARPIAIGEAEASSSTSVQRRVDVFRAQLESGRAVIGELEFVGGSDTLAPSADAVFTALARVLQAARGTFLVEAHVAASGDVFAEQWLTDRRAAVVRARLIAAGVPATRLFAMGYGATRPPRTSVHTLASSRIEISRMP